MATSEFFTTATDQSRVKAEIVSAYFRAWAHVMVAQVKKRSRSILGYVDLYSGPGQYDDGTKSTPVLILEQAIQDSDLAGLLATRFNDADAAKTEKLKSVLAGLPGIERMKHAPLFGSEEVTDKFAEKYESAKLPPTLFFLDPWGYKGLSLRLIRACVLHWGCDCIFFFNYKRVNAGLENDLFAGRMDALFGAERAARLRSRLEGLRPKMREQAILEELLVGLREECNTRYALKFPFATDTGMQTSHYLMFVSKGQKGHDIMKNILAGRSSSRRQGVPSLGFNPAEVRQPMLPFGKPLDQLEEDLLQRFAGREMTVQQVFSEHNVDTKYVMRNYKEALRRMEEKGVVVATPAADARPLTAGDKVSMADDVIISFPKS